MNEDVIAANQPTYDGPCEYCGAMGHGIERCPQIDADADAVLALIDDDDDEGAAE